MKTPVIIVLLLVVLCACSTQKGMVYVTPARHVAERNVAEMNTAVRNVAASDSSEYELVVFDPQFETWFLTNYSPAKDHSNEYYQSWNNQYVTDWNYHYMAGHYPRIFENYIDYDDRANYGIDLNRKLYYYFRYVESFLKVPILTVGSKNTT
jgi:hypothetical protein